MQPTNNSEFWDKNLNNYYHLIQSAGFLTQFHMKQKIRNYTENYDLKFIQSLMLMMFSVGQAAQADRAVVWHIKIIDVSSR